MSTPDLVWLRTWPNGAVSVYDEPTEGAVAYERVHHRECNRAIRPENTPCVCEAIAGWEEKGVAY